MESSPSLASSLPSRRARAHSGGGNQVVSCLVDGCNSDLSRCRDYHRRHKVCEQHSKTPRVMIGGMEQRFCQQCSRFHSLGEFDEGKRSCRKRLEGHNRRRRKPQPESLSVNPANFLSAAPGGRFLPYSASSMIPATSAVSSVNWPAVKTEADPSSLIYSGGRSEFNVLSGPPQQQRSLPPSSYAAAAFTRARQFPFLQDSPPHLSASSTHQPFHASGNGGSCSNPKNFFSGTPAPASSPNGLNHVMNTDRALSLLSSSPSSETPEIGLGSLMQQQQSPNHARPSITDLHYSSMGQYHHHHHHPGPHGLDVHGSHAGGGGGALISNFFQSAGSDGPSSSGPHQTISFSWG